MTTLLRRMVNFFRRDRLAAELEEEMRLHVELRARKLAGQGVPDAAFAARRQFGNRATLHEESAGVWGWPSWESLAQDFKVAMRSLRKTPTFTAVAVATLAVGLGINTGVYSVVNAVMVRALPYTDAATLLALWEVSTRDVKRGPERYSVALANVPDYRSLPAIAGVAPYTRASMNLTGTGAPEQVEGEAITSDFFAVLGVAPALGRNVTRSDEGPGAESVVILSHDFWQRRLGGDAGVIGRTVQLDGRPRRVIGVMPTGFRSPAQLTMAARVEFWIAEEYRADLVTNRGDHEFSAFARLRPGVPLETARAQLTALSTNLKRAYPGTNQHIHAAIAPLQDDLARNLTDSLRALLGASALIVLIACVNVANLFLIRAIGRRREIAVRFAMGANRGRVARQFLVESLVVAGAGCASGVAVGYLLMRALVSLAPADLVLIRTVEWDWRVFAVAAVVASFTAALFGLAPAWQASRARPVEAMRDTARSTPGNAQARWRAGFAAAEVALSLILLVGAGLLLKSFVTLMGVDLGFQPERVLVMNIRLAASRYADQAQRHQFFERLEARVRALPRVQSAAFANRLPLRGGWGSAVLLEGEAAGVTHEADYQAVSPGYFATLGIQLLRGRPLTGQDREGQPPVAIVNQAFANRYLQGADALGRRGRRSNGPWFEIVGVVNDIRRGGKAAEIHPQVYLPAAQTGLYPVQLADLAVRTTGDPRALVKAVQTEVWAIDADQPIATSTTLEEIVTASVAQRRFQLTLLLVFAGVAVVLAVVGIYGVLSYSVTQRTAELGIRIALGARPGEIHALVLRQAGAVIAWGVGAGLAGAWALTVYLESLLFQVKAHDWATYGASAAALAAVALGAALLPARRGARIDPMSALKHE